MILPQQQVVAAQAHDVVERRRKLGIAAADGARGEDEGQGSSGIAAADVQARDEEERRGSPGIEAVDVEIHGEEERRGSPGSAAVDAQAHDEGGRPADQQDVRHRPPTFEAPIISRDQVCYTTNINDDPNYRGGANVHSWFRTKPFKPLMFAHQYDDWNDGEVEAKQSYYMQAFLIPTSSSRGERWMSAVDEQLKLWRKLIRQQHPILQSYSAYLETRTLVRVRDESGERELHQELRQSQKAYASNIERFMLVAMRSRKRLGQTVSIDDAIYSCEIITDFFRKLQDAGVVVSVRSLFAHSLLSFYKYLNLNIGTVAGNLRFAAIAYGIRITENEVEKSRNENRSLKTYDDLSETERQQAWEAYCVVRKIVNCVQIEERIEDIME
ncbi:hypothetical protein OSTOST_03062, partial [Ostertagia ostertagi]